MGSAGFQSGFAIIHDAKPHVTSTDSPFKSGEAFATLENFKTAILEPKNDLGRLAGGSAEPRDA